MQTKPEDNFSNIQADFSKLTGDLVSRDAMSVPPVAYRQKRPLLSNWSHGSIKTWLKSKLKLEVDFGSGFLIYSCLFGAGAVIWFIVPFDPPLNLVLIAFIWLALLWFWKGRTGQVMPQYGKGLFALVLGCLVAQVETTSVGTVILDSNVTTMIIGTVERREVDYRGIWRYRIKLTSTQEPSIKRAPQRVMLVARQKHSGFRVGDVIKGRARLTPPSGPALVGGNDFAFQAYFSGIGATGFFFQLPQRLESMNEIHCLRNIMPCLDDHLYRLRSAIAERIRQVIGSDAGALSASIITDERRAISPKVMDALRQSGLAHIVAISGLNMALAAGIFFVGLRVLFSCSQYLAEALPIKKLSAALALIMTLAYYLISGFAVSAERAWIMMSVMLIAVLLDRQALSLRNVALSALIIGVFSPSEIMGASFQMSFAATLALVALYGAWARRPIGDLDRPPLHLGPIWKYARSFVYLVCGTMVTSVIGGLATAPFSIAYFNQIAPCGLIANLMAMPVMGLIVMPAALCAMLLMPFGLDASCLAIMGYGIQLVIDIAIYVSSWSGEYTIGRLPHWFLPVIVTSLTLSAVLRSSLAIFALLPAVLVIALTVIFPRSNPILLIHESGELIMLHQKDRFSTNKNRPSDFIFTQWQRGLNLPSQQVPPHYEKSVDGDEQANQGASDQPIADYLSRRELKEGTFSCVTNQFCIVQQRPFGTLVQALDRKHLAEACDVADIVVTPIASRMQSCRSGARLITGRSLRQTGSLEFFLEQQDPKGYRIEQALGLSMRPWTMHRYYDWRSDDYRPIPPINGSGG